MYDMGELIGERDYDSSRDWGDIEALGRAEAKEAKKEAENAVAEVKKTAIYTKRAKTSQKVGICMCVLCTVFWKSEERGVIYFEFSSCMNDARRSSWCSNRLLITAALETS
jgi:hypothetical protein